jgi:DNA-binding protein HU-beta
LTSFSTNEINDCKLAGALVVSAPNLNSTRRTIQMAGKKMSKSQIIAHMAAKLDIPKKQAALGMEEFVKLAYREAKNSFSIPGLGKLVLVNRAARMGRNPATGEAISIPAKRVVKFRIAKQAKDAILG